MVWKELTTREVARLLGVSEATVKRWADRRFLHSEKTAGGHRRFHPESVARFLREQGAEAKTRAPLETRAVGSAAPLNESAEAGASNSYLFDALVQGRPEDAASFLINQYLHGRTLSLIFDETLSPLMRRIGDLWYEGDLTVAQEHLATRTALTALYRLREVTAVEEAKGLRAICCGIEGDFHDLPVHFAQALLKSKGWEAISLGANTPFFALQEAMLRYCPALVCVSSTIFNNPDRGAREYEEVLKTAASVGAVIVLGGAGLKDAQLRRRFRADLHAESFQQLSEFADALASSHVKLRRS